MSKIDLKNLKIRIMKEEDLDFIIVIGRMIAGRERAEYFRRKLNAALSRTDHLVTSLVAEINGKVIGFIMGNVYLGEFGIPETTASLDTIGVHPDYQGQGVAVELIKQFIANIKKTQAEYAFALVNWNDWDMLKFLEKSGFVPSKAVKLELEL